MARKEPCFMPSACPAATREAVARSGEQLVGTWSDPVNGLAVLITRHPQAGHHLSVSARNRLPSYYELKAARYQFLRDIPYMVQVLPPEDEFVNLHPHCLHLWEAQNADNAHFRLPFTLTPGTK